MKKRLIVCCDGTWDKLSDRYPTNVVKLARAFRFRSQEGDSNFIQVVYYDEGLGTNSLLDRLPGGAFGLGIGRDIRDAYTFLCMNYSEGDEIYLFGFSRGAYTVRCLAQIIGDHGILKRHAIRFIPQIYWYYRLTKQEKENIEKHEKGRISSRNARDISRNCKNPFNQSFKEYQVAGKTASSFLRNWLKNILPNQVDCNAEIDVLGCFDTVGQVGIPDVIGYLPFDVMSSKLGKRLASLLAGNLGFHDEFVNCKVKKALHASSIDEPRRYLRNTLMKVKPDNTSTELKQVWFPGYHGSVGGGNVEQKSNIALNWMVDQFDPDRTQINGDKLPSFDLEIDSLEDFSGKPFISRLPGFSFLRKIPEGTMLFKPGDTSGDMFHPSVIERLCKYPKEGYRPRNLLEKGHFKELENVLRDCSENST